MKSNDSTGKTEAKFLWDPVEAIIQLSALIFDIGVENLTAKVQSC